MPNSMLSVEKNCAVSEILGVIFVLITITTAVSLTLGWAVPQMQNRQSRVRTESVLAQFNVIDMVFKDVTSQGFTSSKTANLAVDTGTVDVENADRFVIFYTFFDAYDINLSGFNDDDDRNFTIIIEKEPGLNPPDWGVQSFSIKIYYIYLGINEEINISYNGATHVTTNYSLSDVVRIDINGVTPSVMLMDLPHGYVWGRPGVIGRIWLFDLNSIRYRATALQGTYTAVVENYATVMSTPNGCYISDEPKILRKNNTVIINLLQIKQVSGIGSGSGKATYQIEIEFNKTYIWEDRRNLFFSPLKMQIYGKYSSGWVNYFKTKEGFSQYVIGNGTGTLYLPGGLDICDASKNVTIIYSVCDITIKMI